ncbi:MAG: hydrogenase nickel incorporation protein HypB [Hydrogenovibrio crunogenus]|uniref:Hydrogenase maturation factor HypB n=1 Tax=Hydrogenovibrio crunogenus TaxID=39765 RepID=A0A4P7NYA2_9GAMM|nr:hydrogenase nickel incorporation protein HypB [Hydrogenovibrio crunogenus]MBD3612913.1 hydrogenase nickel incorporation protein HypB [Hydrogenovibrio crunogenus]QBZ82771.1 Hydrogenase isoenzymes nickel incorporation protein HypB [Hydrogenovibrio crunogenus]
MCTVCGCGEGEVSIEGSHAHHHDHSHNHDHSHDHNHEHSHEHTHAQEENGDLNYGAGPAHAHAPGMSQSRMVEIEQNILSKNDEYAHQNRHSFAHKGIFALNLVSSPGSGKTTLLTDTMLRLKDKLPLAVIEGDQQTANDADRIRETGVPAIQVNTGKGCHLDAHMVGHATEHLGLDNYSVLFIENVGNLVCPSAFDLGEDHKVAILSVTEGEDKPIKYPDMFAASSVMLLNKVDLLPYLDFDVDACIRYAQKVNPEIEVIQVSAKSGEGMDDWVNWLLNKRKARLQAEKSKMKAQMNALEQAIEA